jgi:hypothetical protein
MCILEFLLSLTVADLLGLNRSFSCFTEHLQSQILNSPVIFSVLQCCAWVGTYVLRSMSLGILVLGFSFERYLWKGVDLLLWCDTSYDCWILVSL